MLPNTPHHIEAHLKDLSKDLAGEARPHVRSDNNHRKSTAVEALARHPSLAKMAAELLRVDTVRLYQDAAFWKLPGGGAGPWHRHALWPAFVHLSLLGCVNSLSGVASTLSLLPALSLLPSFFVVVEV